MLPLSCDSCPDTAHAATPISSHYNTQNVLSDVCNESTPITFGQDVVPSPAVARAAASAQGAQGPKADIVKTDSAEEHDVDFRGSTYTHGAC